ncbi:hypothetical protein BDR26DRAFT_865024 [Obelidium mucronatum]|nr:hypothetical protein BDR26DRAFT_865024 [Obelidium mucronatum]
MRTQSKHQKNIATFMAVSGSLIGLYALAKAAKALSAKQLNNELCNQAGAVVAVTADDEDADNHYYNSSETQTTETTNTPHDTTSSFQLNQTRSRRNRQRKTRRLVIYVRTRTGSQINEITTATKYPPHTQDAADSNNQVSNLLHVNCCSVSDLKPTLELSELLPSLYLLILLQAIGTGAIVLVFFVMVTQNNQYHYSMSSSPFLSDSRWAREDAMWQQDIFSRLFLKTGSQHYQRYPEVKMIPM